MKGQVQKKPAKKDGHKRGQVDSVTKKVSEFKGSGVEGTKSMSAQGEAL